MLNNEKKSKRSFSPQFRAESVQLVVSTGRLRVPSFRPLRDQGLIDPLTAQHGRLLPVRGRLILGQHAGTVLGCCGIVVAEPEGRQTRYEIADPHLSRGLTALVEVTLAVDEDAPCTDSTCTVPGCSPPGTR